MSADLYLVEPVQRSDEDWITFSRRRDASPYGRAARARADALNSILGAEHRAEALRDARQADAIANRIHRICPEQI